MQLNQQILDILNVTRVAKRPTVIIEVRTSNALLVTAVRPVHVKMKLGDNAPEY